MDFITDSYCTQCRSKLSRDKAMDEQHAWCDECESVVPVTHFQTKLWVLGVVLIMIGNLLFRLWL